MADRTAVEQVVFHRPKAGAGEEEWEDCAGYDPGDMTANRPARYVVVDGATEAYDSIRWVRQLVTSFLGLDSDAPPTLTPADLDSWIGRMQQRWLDEAPRAFASLFEERKFHEDGSFATFLGCEIHGLGGPQPRWSAAALGDAVLFHVRDGQLVAQFPPLSPDDFGVNPDGVFTQTSQRDRMSTALQVASGPMQVGDLLFLATDALAAWLAEASRLGGGRCWHLLSAVEHPTEFRRFVARERNARRMKNDDVTLLRVQVTPAEADVLVVCR
jgi:hypothetical protein